MNNDDILSDVISKDKGPQVETSKVSTTCLNNRYLVGERIGVGGLSEVYEVKDSYAEYFKDGRRLAMKRPSAVLRQKKDVAAFVYAEYAILSCLSHPCVVKVHNFGIDNMKKVPYIILEHLDGRLLNDISLVNFDAHLRKNLTNSLFAVIHYLHMQDVVHADINPTNIMCLEDGSIRLFDFGISQNMRQQQTFQLAYTKVRAYNPLYAAPEILEGGAPSKRSDIFSLAVVLFEIYSGKLPYQKESLELRETPVPLRDFNALPVALRYWFRSALRADPEQRPDQISSFIRIKTHIS